MFYFQYVIESIKLDYAEFSPEIFIRFGELSNKLLLSDLELGNNSLGLGKELTLDISKDELEVWFQEYAFCIELKGGILNGRSLIGICSLQKLSCTQQIDGYTIVLKDLSNRQNTAQLVFSLKFKHIHSNLVTKQIPETVYVEKKKENNLHERKLSQTMKNTSKNNTFLNDNSSNSRLTQKRNTNHSGYKKPKDFKKTAQFPKSNKSIKINQKQQFQNQQNQPQNFIPYPLYYDKQVAVDIPTSALFTQQYFCPPPMEFTNDPVRQQVQYIEIPEPVVQLPKQVTKVFGKQEMDNYSFQGNLIPQNKKIQKHKVKDAIEKKKIKQLVYQQFSNKQGVVVVPIKTSNGQIVFKRLDQIKQSDLQNLVSKKKQPQKKKQPIIQIPIASNIQKPKPKPQPQPSQINNSVQYPQDFESMSLGYQSVLNKSFGTTNKKKPSENVVLQESISQVSYSDNFESYSASRSNIKKSYDDISQSLRSFSQSFKR